MRIVENCLAVRLQQRRRSAFLINGSMNTLAQILEALGQQQLKELFFAADVLVQRWRLHIEPRR